MTHWRPLVFVAHCPLCIDLYLLYLQTMLTAISMSAIATNGVVPGEQNSQCLCMCADAQWTAVLLFFMGS